MSRRRKPDLEGPIELGDASVDQRVASQVAAKIAHRHGLPDDDLFERSRHRRYTAARAELYDLLLTHGWSLRRIARFAGRDRKTVRFGLRALAAGKYSIPLPTSHRKKHPR